MKKAISRILGTFALLAIMTLFASATAQQAAWQPHPVGADFPRLTLVGGEVDGRPQPICRMTVRGGTYPGRVFYSNPILPPTCNVGFGGSELFDIEFEILVGENVSWAGLAENREGAVVGGASPAGEKIAICRAQYQGGVHVGYIDPNSGCVIGYLKRAIALSDFQVLYNDVPPAATVQPEQQVVVETTTTTTPVQPANAASGGLTGQLIVPAETQEAIAVAPIAPQSILITPMTNVLSCEQTVALRPATYVSLKGGSDYTSKIDAMNQWLNCSSALNTTKLESLGEKGTQLAGVRTAMIDLVNSQRTLSDLRNGDATLSAELYNQQKISIEQTIADLADSIDIGQDAFEAEPLAALIGNAKGSIIENVRSLQQVDANLLARNLGQGGDFAGSWRDASNLYIESLNTLNQTNIDNFPNSLLEYEVMDLTAQLTDNWMTSLALP